MSDLGASFETALAVGGFMVLVAVTLAAGPGVAIGALFF